jgi:hypothetical protein
MRLVAASEHGAVEAAHHALIFALPGSDADASAILEVTVCFCTVGLPKEAAASAPKEAVR